MGLCVTYCGLIPKVRVIQRTTTTLMYVYVFPPDIDDWGVSPRGAGFLFGSDVVAQV